MAKWGEGDPRWIVEERADAKNVNNWHWTEKNATQWSKDKFKELLLNLKIENKEFVCEIKEITKMEGEAIANNRKGKLIFFYEWVLEADWEGKFMDSVNKTVYKGKLEIPNLSEENDSHELDVSVTTTSNSLDAIKVKEFMRLIGADTIRTHLGQYIKDLKEEYGKDMILPTKDKPSCVAPTGPNTAKIAMNQPHSSDKTSSPATGDPTNGKLITKKLTMSDEFFCTPDDLFKVFTEKELLGAFSRSEVNIRKEKGGPFVLFGGTITGFFDDFAPPNSITLRWRHKSWPSDHHSQVQLKFSSVESGTRLDLTQSGIPQQSMETTRMGWKTNYFEAIKQTFGYGGRIF